jgi:glycosyltransferase involved in cell wall biosynthesis
VIPNPVLPPPARPLCADGKKDPCRVVYVGRLSAVKGLDRLLRAYAKVAPRHRQWHLELWGDGPESGPLKELAEQLSMTDRVRFGGWTDSPYSVLRDADLFVMSSHTEGFPMGLCEAMACGVPPVSFDCPSGPRHIIRHGIDGVLVQNGDVDSLAEAMGQLMGDEEARNRLASRAPEVLERFSARKVLAMWEDLFRQVTGRESHAGRKACV